MRFRLPENETALVMSDKILNNNNSDILSDMILWKKLLGLDCYSVIDIFHSGVDLSNKITLVYLYTQDDAGEIIKLKALYPNKKIAVFIGYSLFPDMLRYTLKTQTMMYNDIKAADCVIVTSTPEFHYYKHINSRIENVGIPFDFDNIAKTDILETNKNKVAISIGAEPGAEIFRNYITMCAALEKIKLNNWQNLTYNIISPSLAESDLKMLETNFTGFQITPQYSNISDYYREISSCAFVVQMNVSYTLGRICAEAAYFNKLCIGSNMVDYQNELFPKFSIDPFSMDGLITLILNLKKNPQMEIPYLNFARNQLQKFSFKSIKRNFYDALIRKIDWSDINV